VSSDAVAVLEIAPDEAMTIAALHATVPQLSLEQDSTGALHLFDDADRRWFTIDPPLLVQVEGEADRLLGHGPPVPCPGWWVEVRADASVAGAVDAGRAMARALAQLGQGTFWRTTT
jgi:hypothetical protein